MVDTISQERLDEIIAETGVDEAIIMNILSYVGIRLEDQDEVKAMIAGFGYLSNSNAFR